jgi:SpoVK/Ycf46/Vps4 family AAA+-type ATPase
MVTIDRASFLLLDEYSTSLKTIAEKLDKDATFAAQVAKETKGTTTSSYTIAEYVFFEIATIFNHCIDQSRDNENEKFGIVYTGLKFYNPSFITHKNLEALVRGENREVTEYYSNYAKKVKDYNKALPSNTPSLLFPRILKASQHPLFDEYATSLYRFASLVVRLDKEVKGTEEAALKIVWQLTHYPLDALQQESIKTPPGAINQQSENPEETLEDILKELNSLVGLTRVKDEVSTLVNFIKIQKEREGKGLKTSQVSYHCVFVGAPGTGKTTVARIIARIYKKLGVLTKGHLIETDRAGLIAEYSGQTATKVDNVVQSALDGILFIDEAYALIGENKDDYGKEAVATLIKRMEDYRGRLVLIVAGYTDQMSDFINNNPGLKSRFNRYLHFEDYTTKELAEIYKSFCTKLDYKLTKKASTKLNKVLNELIENKDESFGNGRLSRNIFEKSIEKQANRLAKSIEPLTKELLISIEEVDIPEAGNF